jgi:hypothetical protein
MQALRVSDDLQDAVARGLAGTRLVPVLRLRAALREAGVPDRVALRVEDRLVIGWEVWCGDLVFSLFLKNGKRNSNVTYTIRKLLQRAIQILILYEISREGNMNILIEPVL